MVGWSVGQLLFGVDFLLSFVFLLGDFLTQSREFLKAENPLRLRSESEEDA